MSTYTHKMGTIPMGTILEERSCSSDGKNNDGNPEPGGKNSDGKSNDGKNNDGNEKNTRPKANYPIGRRGEAAASSDSQSRSAKNNDGNEKSVVDPVEPFLDWSDSKNLYLNGYEASHSELQKQSRKLYEVSLEWNASNLAFCSNPINEKTQKKERHHKENTENSTENLSLKKEERQHKDKKDERRHKDNEKEKHHNDNRDNEKKHERKAATKDQRRGEHKADAEKNKRKVANAEKNTQKFANAEKNKQKAADAQKDHQKDQDKDHAKPIPCDSRVGKPLDIMDLEKFNTVENLVTDYLGKTLIPAIHALHLKRQLSGRAGEGNDGGMQVDVPTNFQVNGHHPKQSENAQVNASSKGKERTQKQTEKGNAEKGKGKKRIHQAAATLVKNLETSTDGKTKRVSNRVSMLEIMGKRPSKKETIVPVGKPAEPEAVAKQIGLSNRISNGNPEKPLTNQTTEAQKKKGSSLRSAPVQPHFLRSGVSPVAQQKSLDSTSSAQTTLVERAMRTHNATDWENRDLPGDFQRLSVEFPKQSGKKSGLERYLRKEGLPNLSSTMQEISRLVPPYLLNLISEANLDTLSTDLLATIKLNNKDALNQELITEQLAHELQRAVRKAYERSLIGAQVQNSTEGLNEDTEQRHIGQGRNWGQDSSIPKLNDKVNEERIDDDIPKRPQQNHKPANSNKIAHQQSSQNANHYANQNAKQQANQHAKQGNDSSNTQRNDSGHDVRSNFNCDLMESLRSIEKDQLGLLDGPFLNGPAYLQQVEFDGPSLDGSSLQALGMQQLEQNRSKNVMAPVFAYVDSAYRKPYADSEHRAVNALMFQSSAGSVPKTSPSVTTILGFLSSTKMSEARTSPAKVSNLNSAQSRSRTSGVSSSGLSPNLSSLAGLSNPRGSSQAVSQTVSQSVSPQRGSNRESSQSVSPQRGSSLAVSLAAGSLDNGATPGLGSVLNSNISNTVSNSVSVLNSKSVSELTSLTLGSPNRSSTNTSSPQRSSPNKSNAQSSHTLSPDKSPNKSDVQSNQQSSAQHTSPNKSERESSANKSNQPSNQDQASGKNSSKPSRNSPERVSPEKSEESSTAMNSPKRITPIAGYRLLEEQQHGGQVGLSGTSQQSGHNTLGYNRPGYPAYRFLIHPEAPPPSVTEPRGTQVMASEPAEAAMASWDSHNTSGSKDSGSNLQASSNEKKSGGDKIEGHQSRGHSIETTISELSNYRSRINLVLPSSILRTLVHSNGPMFVVESTADDSSNVAYGENHHGIHGYRDGNRESVGGQDGNYANSVPRGDNHVNVTGENYASGNGEKPPSNTPMSVPSISDKEPLSNTSSSGVIPAAAFHSSHKQYLHKGQNQYGRSYQYGENIDGFHQNDNAFHHQDGVFHDDNVVFHHEHYEIIDGHQYDEHSEFHERGRQLLRKMVQKRFPDAKLRYFRSLSPDPTLPLPTPNIRPPKFPKKLLEKQINHSKNALKKMKKTIQLRNVVTNSEFINNANSHPPGSDANQVASRNDNHIVHVFGQANIVVPKSGIGCISLSCDSSQGGSSPVIKPPTIAPPADVVQYQDGNAIQNQLEDGIPTCGGTPPAPTGTLVVVVSSKERSSIGKANTPPKNLPIKHFTRAHKDVDGNLKARSVFAPSLRLPCCNISAQPIQRLVPSLGATLKCNEAKIEGLKIGGKTQHAEKTPHLPAQNLLVRRQSSSVPPHQRIDTDHSIATSSINRPSNPTRLAPPRLSLTGSIECSGGLARSGNRGSLNGSAAGLGNRSTLATSKTKTVQPSSGLKVSTESPMSRLPVKGVQNASVQNASNQQDQQPLFSMRRSNAFFGGGRDVLTGSKARNGIRSLSEKNSSPKNSNMNNSSSNYTSPKNSFATILGKLSSNVVKSSSANVLKSRILVAKDQKVEHPLQNKEPKDKANEPNTQNVADDIVNKPNTRNDAKNIANEPSGQDGVEDIVNEPNGSKRSSVSVGQDQLGNRIYRTPSFGPSRSPAVNSSEINSSEIKSGSAVGSLESSEKNKSLVSSELTGKYDKIRNENSFGAIGSSLAMSSPDSSSKSIASSILSSALGHSALGHSALGHNIQGQVTHTQIGHVQVGHTKVSKRSLSYLNPHKEAFKKYTTMTIPDSLENRDSLLGSQFGSEMSLQTYGTNASGKTYGTVEELPRNSSDRTSSMDKISPRHKISRKITRPRNEKTKKNSKLHTETAVEGEKDTDGDGKADGARKAADGDTDGATEGNAVDGNKDRSKIDPTAKEGNPPILLTAESVEAFLNYQKARRSLDLKGFKFLS